MAVYTEVPRSGLDRFLQGFDLGGVVSFTPIAEGIENTNYLLQTAAGKFILTLFEARMNPADLPFHVELMKHLAASGIPCPVPVPDSSGDAIHSLCGKPALVTTFLDGKGTHIVTPRHCHALGEACAALHLAGMDFGLQRPNDLSVSQWRTLHEASAGQADSLAPGLHGRILEEIEEVEQLWPDGLPAGVVHADLFPDNVFFKGDELTGLIDFYFACNDFLAYDLAICLNSWCFRTCSEPEPGLLSAMIKGYETVRPLREEERTALPVLARGAALRFLLTRLEDWFKTNDNRLLHRKNPLELLPIIEFHRRNRIQQSYDDH